MQYRRARVKGGTFFFTVVTHGRRKIFCKDANVKLVREAFRRVIDQSPFVIDAFVLLPNHIHCIWTLPEDDHDFSTRWRLFKSYFTRRCLSQHKAPHTPSRVRKGEQAVWQRRFWEHMIRDEDDFKSHVDYIHYNPVRHGLVNSPKEWPYSSFNRYVRQGIYSMEWGAADRIAIEINGGRE